MRNTGALPPTKAKTGFPIFVESTRWNSSGAEQRALDGVSEAVRTRIKSMQPFATGEYSRSPLWHLHEVSNWDKHTGDVLAAGQKGGGEVVFNAEEAEEAFYRDNSKPLTDGAVLFRLTLKPSDAPFENRLSAIREARFGFYTTFREPTVLHGAGVAETLDAIAKHAEAVTAELIALAF